MPIAANYPSINPSISLDFANSQQLDPRISFTRAGTGTYYDGETSAVAEQNLLTYSEQFDNAVWKKFDTTVTANSTTAPDGATTADTFTENSGSVFPILLYTTAISLTSGTTYTGSVYFKANGRDIVGVYFNTQSFAETGRVGWFNLSTQATQFQSGVTGTITSVGNGWYRCTITATADATNSSIENSLGVFIASSLGSLANYTGNGTSGVFIWGAQFEQKSGASGYQATTTIAITNYIPQLLTAVANQPRFDFNPTTRQSLGLLMEQSSVNLLTYSSDYTNAAWGEYDITATASSNISPDGTLNAQLLTENTANALHCILPATACTVSSGATVTNSIYLKAKEIVYAAVWVSDAVAKNYPVLFNLSNGTVVGNATGFNLYNAPTSSSITSVGNGWYRCTVTATIDAARTTVSLGVAPNKSGSTSGSFSYTGDGTSGFYAWGAQVETTAFPTSYIPTVASTVTRAQDFATISGTNFSSWFNNQQGTAYCSFDSAGIGAPDMAYWSIDNATSSNGYISYRTGASLRAYAGLTFATVGTVTANTTQQVTFTYNNIAPMTASGSLNGATAVAISSPVQLAYVPTQLSLGKFGTNTGSMTGHIRKFAYYPIATTATNLQALTGS